MTVGRFIEKFLDYLEIERNVSRNTLTNYNIDLRDFLKFIKDTPAESIDRITIRKYLVFLQESKYRKITISRRVIY